MRKRNITIIVSSILAMIGFIANIDGNISFFEKIINIFSVFTYNIQIMLYVIIIIMCFIILILFLERGSLIQKIEIYRAIDRNFLDRLVESFRTIKLDYYQTPDKSNLIGDLIEDLKKRLPKDNENDFRITIIEPLNDGSINIIADYGLNEKRRQELKNNTNWKSTETPTLYREGILTNENYFWSDNNNVNHYGGKYNPNYKSSKVHFIIPIKDEKYSIFETEGCIGLISISSPNEKSLPRDELKNSRIYYSLYNVIKGIESILLEYKSANLRK